MIDYTKEELVELLNKYPEKFNEWKVEQEEVDLSEVDFSGLTLREIDFSKVDIMILCYGFNDYLQSSRNIGDEVYSEQPYGTLDSLSGSLDSSLQNLNDRFPAMQIIISSPSFCIVEDEDGNEIGADLYNPGNGSLGDYVAFTKGVAQSHQASFADNYFFSDFNAGNYEGLLDENGMPNAAARKLIADHIISFFYFNR